MIERLRSHIFTPRQTIICPRFFFLCFWLLFICISAVKKQLLGRHVCKGETERRREKMKGTVTPRSADVGASTTWRIISRLWRITAAPLLVCAPTLKAILSRTRAFSPSRCAFCMSNYTLDLWGVAARLPWREKLTRLIEAPPVKTSSPPFIQNTTKKTTKMGVPGSSLLHCWTLEKNNFHRPNIVNVFLFSQACAESCRRLTGQRQIAIPPISMARYIF